MSELDHDAPAVAGSTIRGHRSGNTLRGGIALALLALLVLGILWRIFNPADFILSVQANTSFVKLLRSEETPEERWRLRNAIVCLPDERVTEMPAALVILEQDRWQNVCGSRIAIASERREMVLSLKGEGPVEFHRFNDDTLKVSVYAKQSKFSWGSSVESYELPDRYRIYFPPEPVFQNQGSADPMHVSVFAFNSEVVLGEGAGETKHADRLLLDGFIRIYRETGVGAEDRSQVAEETLLMGDQVSLAPYRDSKRMVYPKGFVRLDPKADNLDAVVFSDVNTVKVSRFGDPGYGYSLSWFTRVVADPVLSFLVSMILGMLALLGGLFALASGDDMLAVMTRIARLLRRRHEEPSDAA